MIEVIVSSRFQRDLRTLAKRYRKIKSDVQPIIEQLQAGELPGDQIAGVGYSIFKVRVKNSDIEKGKSGGYRLIYYLKASTKVILIAIYSKSDQGNISAAMIQAIVTEYEQ